MSSAEYDYEAVPGVPGVLPAGERLLWQGGPEWHSFFQRALPLRAVLGYFGLLAGWRFVSGLTETGSLQFAAVSAFWIVPLCLTVVAIMAAFSYAVARTTLYTITEKRVIFRFGLAVPVAINVPFAKIATADLNIFADGTGHIPLKIFGVDRFSFFLLWPHARGWQITHPQPMLKSVSDCAKVADILSAALAASQSGASAPVTVQKRDAVSLDQGGVRLARGAASVAA
jgi:Bacterial PH domain